MRSQKMSVVSVLKVHQIKMHYSMCSIFNRLLFLYKCKHQELKAVNQL